MTSGDGGNNCNLVGVNGGASHGTVTMSTNGDYTYTPAANYNGTDVFTYQLCDTDGDCSTATVTITIVAVDDFPITVNDGNSIIEDTTVSGSVSGNDTQKGDCGKRGNLVGGMGGASHRSVTMSRHGDDTYTLAEMLNCVAACHHHARVLEG